MNPKSPAQNDRSSPTRPSANRPSSARSPNANQSVQASEHFQIYCQELADDYAIHGHSRLLHCCPIVFIVIGMILAFTLIYVELRWFFFGPAFAVAGLASFVLTGAVRGRMVLRDRLWRWSKVWPIWEYAFVSLFALFLFAASVVYGFWPSLFMGSVVGAVLALVIILATLPNLREQQQALFEPFDQLVSNIESQNISPLRIQAGLPSVMGTNWILLFEAKFGYHAYRSVAQQLSGLQPELMTDRPVVRDWILDTLSLGINQRKGLFGTLALFRSRFYESLQASKTIGGGDRRSDASPSTDPSFEVVKRDQWEVLDPELPHQHNGLTSTAKEGTVSVANLGEDIGVDGQYESGGGPQLHAHLHADQINIGTMHTHNQSMGMSREEMLQLAGLAQSIELPKPRGHKKAAYDTMLQEAWSDRTRRRMRFPTLQKWLGEEMRMGVGILLAIVFLSYLVHAGLFDVKSRNEIASAFDQADGWSASGVKNGTDQLYAVASGLPARLPLLSVSGWSIGVVSMIWFATGFFRDGWPYSFFVAPATIIVVSFFTIAIGSSDAVNLAITGVVISLIVLLAGVFLDRKIPDWIEAYYRRIKKSPS